MLAEFRRVLIPGGRILSLGAAAPPSRPPDGPAPLLGGAPVRSCSRARGSRSRAVTQQGRFFTTLAHMLRQAAAHVRSRPLRALAAVPVLPAGACLRLLDRLPPVGRSAFPVELHDRLPCHRPAAMSAATTPDLLAPLRRQPETTSGGETYERGAPRQGSGQAGVRWSSSWPAASRTRRACPTGPCTASPSAGASAGTSRPSWYRLRSSASATTAGFDVLRRALTPLHQARARSGPGGATASTCPWSRTTITSTGVR